MDACFGEMLIKARLKSINQKSLQCHDFLAWVQTGINKTEAVETIRLLHSDGQRIPRQ